VVGIIKSLMFFFATLGLWTLLLWFGLRLDFSDFGVASLLGLHVFPPLAIWLGGWWLIRRRRNRQAAEEQAAADHQRQEDARATEAARQRHAAELVQRQFALPVLAAAFGGWLESGSDQAVTPGAAAVAVLPLADAADDDDDPDADSAGRLVPHVRDALAETYLLCPGAAAFSIVVRGPAEWGSAEGVSVVRAALADESLPFAEAGFAGEPGLPLPAVQSLPSGPALADTLLGQFDADPDLPGLLVLAFDSPYARHAALDTDDDQLPAAEIERRRWQGQPAQGVVALALANPRLAAMLEQVAAAEVDELVGDFPAGQGGHGAPRPYWEAGNALPSRLLPLAALSVDARQALAEAVPLAHLHRPVAGECAPRPGRVNQLADAARRAIERALVNARVLPAPDLAAAATDAPPADDTPPSPACDWLVHNAGGIDCAGQRLAALSLALHTFGIDLNPIDEATNFPARVGDLGAALPLALLAQAINKAAETASPACWVEFAGMELFHVGFVAPGVVPLNAAPAPTAA